MKLAAAALLLSALATLGLAAAPRQQVIVSYPKDTPESVLQEAKDAIVKAGGIIVHEYNLIKGFAAEAPAKALEMVQTLGLESNVVIEGDQPVGVLDS